MKGTQEVELSQRQRVARLAVALGVLVALAVGSLWGDDEHFPFGPFRMYSVRNDPNGTVLVTSVRGTSIDGDELRIPFSDLGIRRAELDGQLTRFFADDSRLAGHVVESYENMGSRPPVAELRIIRTIHQLEAGRVVSSSERTLGVWRRSE